MEKIAIRTIEKEELPNVSFRKEEVLFSDEQVTLRWRELNRGMVLGNQHKLQTELRFENSDGEILEIKASIWTVTMKHVILKGGVFIPISSIHDVTV